MTPRFLGLWTLPSGKSCDVTLKVPSFLSCVRDVPPTAYPQADLTHGRDVRRYLDLENQRRGKERA